MSESHNVRTIESAELLARLDPEKRLNAYYRLILEENERVNLVSRETGRSGLAKLAAESLVPFDGMALENVRSYLDIGSGGGYPAIPLLITHAGLGGEIQRAVLCERTQKKAAALSRMITALELRAEATPTNFEEYRTDRPFDLITLRYVALTPQLLAAILGVLAKSGVFAYYSEPDFDLSGLKISCETHRFVLSGEDNTRRYSLLRKKH